MTSIRMSSLILIVLAITIILIGVNAMRSATMEMMFDNRRIDANVSVEYANILKIPCMSECLNYANCASVGYQSDQMKCRLHSVLVSSSNGVPENGWVYFSSQRAFCSEENFVLNQALDICYYVLPGTRTCSDANDTCASFSAKLLIVDSQEKQDWVEDICVANHIDGIFMDMYLDGVWKLGSTGMAPSYVYWDAGQPDDLDGCVGTKPHFNWQWHDYNSIWTAGTVCEIRRP